MNARLRLYKALIQTAHFLGCPRRPSPGGELKPSAGSKDRGAFLLTLCYPRLPLPLRNISVWQKVLFPLRWLLGDFVYPWLSRACAQCSAVPTLSLNGLLQLWPSLPLRRHHAEPSSAASEVPSPCAAEGHCVQPVDGHRSPGHPFVRMHEAVGRRTETQARAGRGQCPGSVLSESKTSLT